MAETKSVSAAAMSGVVAQAIRQLRTAAESVNKASRHIQQIIGANAGSVEERRQQVADLFSVVSLEVGDGASTDAEMAQVLADQLNTVDLALSGGNIDSFTISSVPDLLESTLIA